MRNYDDVCVGVVNLVREIRDNSLYVHDFDLSELNVILRDVTTYGVLVLCY